MAKPIITKPKRVFTQYVIKFQKIKFDDQWSLPMNSAYLGVFFYDLISPSGTVQICYENPQGKAYTIVVTCEPRPTYPPPRDANPNATAWIMNDIIHIYGYSSKPVPGDQIV